MIQFSLIQLRCHQHNGVASLDWSVFQLWYQDSLLLSALLAPACADLLTWIIVSGTTQRRLQIKIITQAWRSTKRGGVSMLTNWKELNRIQLMLLQIFCNGPLWGEQLFQTRLEFFRFFWWSVELQRQNSLEMWSTKNREQPVFPQRKHPYMQLAIPRPFRMVSCFLTLNILAEELMLHALLWIIIKWHPVIG